MTYLKITLASLSALACLVGGEIPPTTNAPATASDAVTVRSIKPSTTTPSTPSDVQQRLAASI